MQLRVRAGAGIKPAVDNFRHAAHGSAAVRAGKMDPVHIRSVQLHLLAGSIARKLRKLTPRTDDNSLAAVRAFPDRERCSPVSVTGESPVLNVLKPVAETSLAHGRRNPVDLFVVAYKIVADSGHLDEPGLSRIVDKRRIASPAVRIIVFHLRRAEQDAALFQILQNLGIAADSAFFDLMLRRLAAHAGKLSGLGFHAAVAVHHLNKRRVVLPSDSGVVFTECRSDMNYAGTICHGNIIVRVDEECLFMLFCHSVCGTLVQRLVFLVFKVFTLICLQHLIGGLSVRILLLVFRERSEDLVQKRRSHVIGKSVDTLYLRVCLFGIYAEGNVGRQCPGGCRPCEEIRVLVLEESGVPQEGQ